MFSRNISVAQPLLGIFPRTAGLAARSPVFRETHLARQQQRRTAYIRFQDPRHQYQRFQHRSQTLRQLWQSPNFRKFVWVAAGGSGSFYFYNLETVPVSGRRRFNFVSPAMEVEMAKQMYGEVKRNYGGQILHTWHPTTRFVKKVMDRLVPVSGLDDLNWEVFVIKDDSIKNAFVIPGGKVFVFSGILEISADEDGLAAVMSHEIAHTVAHHSSERMSQSFLVVAGLLLIALVSGGDTGILGNIMDLIYLRPGSRKQEAEADYIGLMMMAQACYNPAKAVNVWERMEKSQEFAPPQFLSTHPSNKARIQNIQSWLPEAMEKASQSGCSEGTLAYAEEFKKAFDYANW